MKKADNNLSFEDYLAQLTKNVSQLERADLPLGEGLKVFEEGVKNIKDCLQILEESQGKITLIKEELDKVLEGNDEY